MFRSNQTIVHDMQFLKRSESALTTARSAECYVCGRGLEQFSGSDDVSYHWSQHGFSITAKTMPNGNALFCDLHYAQQ